jgi:hypothetical protein
MSSSIRCADFGGGLWTEETTLLPYEKPDDQFEIVVRGEAEALWRAYQQAKPVLTSPASTFTFRYDFPGWKPDVSAGVAGKYVEMICQASPQMAYQDYRYAVGDPKTVGDDHYVPLKGAEYFVSQEFQCTSRTVVSAWVGSGEYLKSTSYVQSTAVDIFTIGRVSEQSDVPVTLDGDSFVSVVRDIEM